MYNYAIFFIFAEKYTVMRDFFKIYMQKEGEGSELKETIADFGLYLMEIPFIMFSSTKKLVEREWPGEDGKDVYVPKRLDTEAYTLKIKFGYKGGPGETNKAIKAFWNYLTGNDGSGVYMKIYCDYNTVGRRHVRFSGIPGEPIFVRDEWGDFMVFDVNLNVDDPITDVVPLIDSEKKVINLV